MPGFRYIVDFRLRGERLVGAGEFSEGLFNKAGDMERRLFRRLDDFTSPAGAFSRIAATTVMIKMHVVPAESNSVQQPGFFDQNSSEE